MKRKSKVLLAFVLSLVLTSLITVTAYAATWSSSDRWASWSNGGYKLYNNGWGNGYQYSSIWANSYSNWGVWTQQPFWGGIKAYPNVEKVVNRSLNSLGSLKSSFNISVPYEGSYNSAYDIWTNGYSYEIMLWMNSYGNAKPISYNWNSSGNPVPVYWNVWIGGHSWNIYQGSNGSNTVYSFVRTSGTTSGTVDILAVLKWINGKGWFWGSQTVNKVQFGWEITSSSGRNFNCNSFSCSFY